MGVGGQRHAPTALPPGKRPGTNCTGGWVDHTVGLDGCGKSRRNRDSTPGHPSRSKTQYWLSHPGLRVCVCVCIYIYIYTHIYRGADKYLARPGRKQATFPAFYGTRRFITTFTSPPPVPNLAKSIHSSAHHNFDRCSLFPSWLG